MTRREKIALSAGIALLLISLLSGHSHSFGTALIQHICLMAGAICLAPFLSKIVAAPLCAVVDFLYFGSQGNDTPPLNLRLARGYEAAHRHEDALDEYEKFMPHYPNESELWDGAIRCARVLGRQDTVTRLIHTAPQAWRQLPAG